jgi:hypothetical protein
MKIILRRIREKNTPFLRVLKYFFHIYSLVALVCLMMCPAVHALGKDPIDHIVIKGKNDIQGVLHKTVKKTYSLKLVQYPCSKSDGLVRENQNLSARSLKRVNPSIVFLETTRLIL